MAGGPVELTGVPETMLWTLYYRATEARRPDAVLRDPKAVEFVDAIDYPFEQRFGAAVEWQAQWQGLRARRFDREVAALHAEHPGGTVVALGEGLETQFWRVDDGRVRWLTVDLPESAEVRQRLLPAESDRRRASQARRSTRPGWTRSTPSTRRADHRAGPADVPAADEARGLIAACAARFPGEARSSTPRRAGSGRDAAAGRSQLQRLEAPPMPWG